LEATLRLLLKATDFMVSERSEKFERAIEKVMKGWEGKVPCSPLSRLRCCRMLVLNRMQCALCTHASNLFPLQTVVLNALLSILEQYGWSEDKLVLECYKMIKRLCGYGNPASPMSSHLFAYDLSLSLLCVCVRWAILRLDKERTLLEQTLETLYLEIENILEPEPQSADRPTVGRSFSIFVQGICTLAFQCFKDDNKQRANNACGTGTATSLLRAHSVVLCRP
jgi:hypothetical protein